MLQLEAGCTLQVDHDLQLVPALPLLLGPGGALQATSLTLDGGSVHPLGAGAPWPRLRTRSAPPAAAFINAAPHGGQGYNT